MRFHVDERALDERRINGIVESTGRGFIDPFPEAPETTSQPMFYRNVYRGNNCSIGVAFLHYIPPDNPPINDRSQRARLFPETTGRERDLHSRR